MSDIASKIDCLERIDRYVVDPTIHYFQKHPQELGNDKQTGAELVAGLCLRCAESFGIGFGGRWHLLEPDLQLRPVWQSRRNRLHPECGLDAGQHSQLSEQPVDPGTNYQVLRRSDVRLLNANCSADPTVIAAQCGHSVDTSISCRTLGWSLCALRGATDNRTSRAESMRFNISSPRRKATFFRGSRNCFRLPRTWAKFPELAAASPCDSTGVWSRQTWKRYNPGISR